MQLGSLDRDKPRESKQKINDEAQFPINPMQKGEIKKINQIMTP